MNKIDDIETILYPNAKINLVLNIKNKSITKWKTKLHNLESLMVPITIYDRMIIKKSESFSVKYIDKMVNDEDCIILKTLDVFKIDRSKLDFSIDIKKNIPVKSGLGGASSDAAFFIKYLLQKGFLRNIKKNELFEKACEIGSDIPFFLENKPSIVTGFGEKVFPVSSFPLLFFVIVSYFEKESTKKMYDIYDDLVKIKKDKEFTKKFLNKHKNFKNIFFKIYKKNLQNDKKYVLYIKEIANNDFEQVLSILHPNFGELKNSCEDSLFGQISGAGPSLFYVFSEKLKAMNCFNNLRFYHGRVNFAHVIL
ncbi:MAG TPA: hypothetical protein PK520_04470 [Exilispira sp.]|nr:hypothetical protein [Exilispira sp.]HQQ19321.1 hypothetical protein [Exilispira sp.]